MWTLRTCGLAAAGMVAIAVAGPAWASSGGDSNAGDVWLDNVGQPAGPGHEMDPHLACQDINLWGDGLADGSGSYTISGWPPSGKQEQDYPASGSANWTYDTSAGGDQVTSVINVSQLIQTAQANGDTPAAQGYHFKLQFSQDPQKHKAFWVNCTNQTSGAQSQTSTGSPGASSPTSGAAPTTTGTRTPTAAVNGVSTTRHTTRHRMHPKLHRKHKPSGLRHSTLSRRAVRRHAGFTG
jgi:hypothetical protein